MAILPRSDLPQVLVTDPFATVDIAGVTQTGSADLLAGSDLVVCLAPANAETENLMNAQAFAAMRAASYFINGARGDLLEDAARLHAWVPNSDNLRRILVDNPQQL